MARSGSYGPGSLINPLAAGRDGPERPQVSREDVAAHLCCHPLGLQQCVHAQAVHGGQEPFRFSHERLLRVSFSRVQDHDEATNDGGHGAVAAFGFGGQDGLDPGSMPERHPHASVHRELFVQGQELTEEVQHRMVLLGAFRLRILD